MAEVKQLFRITDPSYCRIPDDEDAPLPPGCSSPVDASTLVISQPAVPPTVAVSPPVIQALFRPSLENMGEVVEKIAKALSPYGIDYFAATAEAVALRGTSQTVYKSFSPDQGDQDQRVYWTVLDILDRKIQELPVGNLSKDDIYRVSEILVADPQKFQKVIAQNTSLDEVGRQIFQNDKPQAVVEEDVKAYQLRFPCPTNETQDSFSKALALKAEEYGLPFYGDEPAVVDTRVDIWEYFKAAAFEAGGVVTKENVESITERAVHTLVRDRLIDSYVKRGYSSDVIAQNIDDILEGVKKVAMSRKLLREKSEETASLHPTSPKIN